MCFFFSLIPATWFLIVGFLILFAASKAEGGVKMFGQILAVWLFVLALFPVMAGAYMSATGQCPMQQMMGQMMERMQKTPMPQ
jgi:hypothetical protein